MATKLRWGILGASSWIARDAIMPGIDKSSNGQIVALGSRSPHKLAGHGEARLMTYEAMLADPAIDAIYIPLPNSMHVEWAIRCAAAGKAVLLEKPLALNLAEASRIVEAFAKHNVPLMESFMYRFHPQHKCVRELLESGIIGDLVEVHTHLSVDLMSPPDYSNIRMKSQLGGGALLDMGCYIVSSARMLFGEEPRAVRAWWKIDPVSGVDIAASAVLEFSAGRTALVSCSFEGWANGMYRIIGRKGVIEVPRALILGLGTRTGEAAIITMDKDGNRSEEILPDTDHYQLIVEAFAEAVLNGKPVPLPVSDALNNMRVIDAFAQSAREGREVRL